MSRIPPALERVHWYRQRSAIVHDGTAFGHELGVSPLMGSGTNVEE